MALTGYGNPEPSPVGTDRKVQRPDGELPPNVKSRVKGGSNSQGWVYLRPAAAKAEEDENPVDLKRS